MPLNRRDFLKGSVVAGSYYLIGPRSQAMAAPTSQDWQSPESPADHYVPLTRYLKPQERRFIEAAVDRLIPEDELGPGALQAGVADFIDYQLGGPFGRAARWYMEGPWREGSDSQGYQLRFTPAELYRHCIPYIDDHCRQHFQNKVFHELSDERKDQLLEELEQGNVPLDIAEPKAFFIMLWQNTKEGFFADPMYGGNRDFAGWRLIGFPGARYNYSPFITEHGKEFRYPPVGILGRKGIPLKEIT